ncbi:MAG: FKBP-type peptidyl-prolyl cis-trans isomerase N-terminal domain-containing protein [Rhabdochlamydiaceae bacterium]
MESSKEKVSYCIGLETAKNLRNQFTDMDEKLLLEGFKDGVCDNNPQLAEEEIRNLMNILKRQIENQQKQFVSQIAKDNKEQGEKFLNMNKEKNDVVVTSSGLQYRILKKGQGPVPTMFDVVSVHYKGSSIENQVFESTYETNNPAVFPVNKVIQGWAEALQMMPVGSKWEIYIPSYLAYGELGYGNAIGPNMALVFEMELLGIN